MDSLFQQLPEVLVRGERPVIKGEKGKLIYDVPRIIEKLPVTNAYEVLKELPGVTEQNGTLSLGGLRVTVVVNGKVTTLDKEQLRAMLEGTPVSRIEKAENHVCRPCPLSGARTDDKFNIKIKLRATVFFERRALFLLRTVTTRTHQ